MPKRKRPPHRRVELGEHFSEGARLIWVRIAALKMTPSEFVTRKGWRRGSLFKYMHGDQKPNRVWAQLLQTELNIDPSDFDRKPVRTFDLSTKAA